MREEGHVDGIVREEEHIVLVPKAATPADNATNEWVEIGNNIFTA